MTILLFDDGSGLAMGEGDLALEGEAVSESRRRRRPEAAREATGDPPMEDPLPDEPELDCGEASLFAPFIYEELGGQD